MNICVELVWKNPGRRPPTPDKVEPAAQAPLQAVPDTEAHDFDFDEEGEGVVTPQRRAPGTLICQFKTKGRKINQVL